jgi:hypothetical protein
MKKGFNHETTTCKSTFGRQLNNNPWESRAGFTEPKTQVKLKPTKIETNWWIEFKVQKKYLMKQSNEKHVQLSGVESLSVE